MVRWVVGSILHGGDPLSSVVRAFAHGVMARRIDPSWGGPIELCGKSVRSWCDGSSDRSFMGDPLSSVVRAFAHGAVGRRIDPSWGTH